MTTKTDRAERRIRAVQLRRAGLNYTAIAAALGISRTRAWEDVNSALTETLTEETGALRQLQSDRLDDMLAALSTKLRRGEVGAVHAAVRILERQAKLWGLDRTVDLALTVEQRAAYAEEFDRQIDNFVAAINADPIPPTPPTPRPALRALPLLPEERPSAARGARPDTAGAPDPTHPTDTPEETR